jgi:hypothetical protein
VSTGTVIILVSHGRSENRRRSPRNLALLREFANSLDERPFVQRGVPDMARDGVASVVALWAWMRSYGLLETGARLGPDNHERAMELRG